MEVICIKKRFWIILGILFITSVEAQELQGLIGEYPFATSLEIGSLSSNLIKESVLFGSHTFERIKNSKLGVFSRYYELANNKEGIPNYYNIQFGTNYRHYFDNGKSLGLMGSFGSSSDKPFRDGRDSTILLNSTYQLNEKWIVLGNYSNNRTFLNNVPLPGFLYVHENSREKAIIFGFPFIYYLKPFYRDNFSIRYIGILPYNHKFKVIFNRLTFSKPYLGFEQGPQVFLETYREAKDMRTFWFERRVMVGAEKSFGPILKIDIQLGNSFHREFFEARSFAKQHKNIRSIHDGIYGSLGLKSSF